MDKERSHDVGSGDSSRLTSSFDKVGDRTRFTVELRQGETTIVSWKKLLKDVTKANAQTLVPAPAPAPAPPTATLPSGPVHPALESRLVPVQPSANDLNDAAPPNRMTGVIEKIERLFMGNDSSDEDLNNIPDDDQYDTEDSFIDDAELDEYFEVDKSRTKHDGFFVNRGKLESIEPSLSADLLPKKRRRRSIETDGPNKQLKVGRKGGGRGSLTVGNNSMPASSTISDSSLMKHQERSTSSQLKLQSGKANCMEDSDKSIPQRDKYGRRVQFDLNIACGVQPIQTVKPSLAHRKEGSGIRSKGNMLEKAIRELEKTVAECRPRNGELPDVDATAQGVKRRLPQEIKHKLAKVARAVQASHGKVSKELLSRLMNIVGHVINLRTLKRNLKILINTSLSANEEKHEKYRRIKNEVVDLISTRAPSLVVKTGEHQSGDSGDFQQPSAEEKAATNVKNTMDAALEDKICDLYEIFVDGLDEDGAPQVRKLYAELAELWPKGVMDNYGIKRAICHAKDRRKELRHRFKDAERTRRKKSMIMKTEETVGMEPSSAAPPEYTQERVTEVGTHITSSIDRFASDASATTATATTDATTTNPTSSTPSLPIPVSSGAKIDRSKNEKLKGTVTGGRSVEMRPGDAPLMKKVKRKRDMSLVEAHPQSEVSSQHSDERHRSHKQHSSGYSVGAVPQKTSFQSASVTNFEQLS